MTNAMAVIVPFLMVQPATPVVESSPARDAQAVFVSPAQQAWRDYRNALNTHVAGVTRHVTYLDDKGRMTNQLILHYRDRGTCWLLKQQMLIYSENTPQTSVDEVYGENSRYAFRLTRNDARSPYVLSGLQMAGRGDAEFMFALTKQRKERLSGTSPSLGEQSSLAVTKYGGFADQWPDIVARKGAVIVRCAPGGHGGSTMDIDISYPDIVGRTVQSRVTFDRDKNWLPVRYEHFEPPHEKAPGVKVQGRNELKSLLPSLHALTKAHWEASTIRRAGQTPVQSAGTEEVSYELVTDPWSESDFTLSAYGLPEPFGVEPPPRPMPWWLYIGACTLATVLLLGLVWRFRKWRAASA